MSAVCLGCSRRSWSVWRAGLAVIGEGNQLLQHVSQILVEQHSRQEWINVAQLQCEQRLTSTSFTQYMLLAAGTVPTLLFMLMVMFMMISHVQSMSQLFTAVSGSMSRTHMNLSPGLCIILNTRIFSLA